MLNESSEENVLLAGEKGTPVQPPFSGYLAFPVPRNFNVIFMPLHHRPAI